MSNAHHNQTSQKTKDLVKTGQEYYVENYKPRAMILSHGKGSKLWDIDGNEYIDFGSGIAVSVFGHQDPELVAAAESQLKKLWHTSNIFYTEPPIMLAEELVNATPFATRAYFCNSGAEANEAAIKLVRKYASDNHPPEKRNIITFTGSFHGRTLATVTATAQPKYQQGFEPLPGGFVYCSPFNDEAAIAKLVDEKTCAVMVEPVQGEGGIIPAKPGFLNHLRQLCDKVGALLVLDEIQTGMGRTGKLFAHMHEEGFEPDIMTLAKALGGGLPIGAMLVGKKAEHTFQFGSHGSTFGGNPVATSVARAVLKKLQMPGALDNVAKQAKAMREGLGKIGASTGIFQEVRGQGLMIGAELKKEWHGKAGDIMEAARLNGVLVLQAGPNVVRLLPPLNITDAEIKEGFARLEAAIREFTAQAA